MRGGISYIAKRYSKGNNRYIQFYGDKKSSKFTMYLDANTLYGWAVSQYLPYGRFKWLLQNTYIRDKFQVFVILYKHGKSKTEQDFVST